MREPQPDQGDRPQKTETRVLRHFDAFAGVGGFTLAMPQFEAVGFSEIDKFASAVLRYRFPNVKNYGDITSLVPADLPDFDLFTFGSPCQDFSIAGKRAGIGGARSGLFLRAVEILREKKPDYFIFENVKGMLSSNRGWDFGRAIFELEESGYSLWWQVLNAKDFGVPQNRERVFVVGTRSDIGSPREVFFERGASSENHGEICPTIRATHYKSGDNQPVVRCPLRFLERNQKNIKGDYAFTVDAGQTAGVTDGMRVRRLMPIEAERLMSWPDGHTQYGDFDGVVKEMSDSQRYKMCGNGVVSAVVAEVVKAHLL